MSLEVENTPLVSIILITYNQREYLERSLPLISDQVYKNFEILAVDSGSKDGSVELLREYGVKVINYNGPTGYKLFNFARAFNLGASNSNGEILVRLSGDVIPKNKQWLSNLVKPLLESFYQDHDIEGRVVATYSQQDNGGDSDFHHKFLTFLVFSEYRDYFEKLAPGFMFWGASAAILRDMWDRYPFSEKQRQGEDVHWGAKMATLGYKILYTPTSEVLHKHNKAKRKATRATIGSLGRFAKMYPPYVTKMLARKVPVVRDVL
jgi:rhamnosyltransferase